MLKKKLFVSRQLILIAHISSKIELLLRIFTGKQDKNTD